MHRKKIKLKKGDTVKVLAGKYKGRTGEIKEIIVKDSSCVIAGVTQTKKHKKPKNVEDTGGIILVDHAIHISNVAYYDSKQEKTGRIGYKISEDGKKSRVLKSTGEVIEERFVKK